MKERSIIIIYCTSLAGYKIEKKKNHPLKPKERTKRLYPSSFRISANPCWALVNAMQEMK